MKNDLWILQQSLQSCLTLLQVLGNTVKNYANDVKVVQRSTCDLVMEYESFGISLRECIADPQKLRGTLEECKKMLREADSTPPEAAKRYQYSESDVPFVSYEIIKKRAEQLRH